MSKETLNGTVCACGSRIAFPEYHWPHCSANPVNLRGQAKSAVEAVFTKSELAQIATHGPMRDEKVQRKGAKVKRTSAKGSKRG